jgi:hypothetical protein
MTTLLHPKIRSARPTFCGNNGAKNVDEVMRDVQGTAEKTQIERFHALSVRVGVAGPLKSVVRRRRGKNSRLEGLTRGKSN